MRTLLDGLRIGAWLLALSVLPDCSSTTSTQAGPRCPPDDERTCLCDNADIGTQTCDAKGTGYGACSCADAGAGGSGASGGSNNTGGSGATGGVGGTSTVDAAGGSSGSDTDASAGGTGGSSGTDGTGGVGGGTAGTDGSGGAGGSTGGTDGSGGTGASGGTAGSGGSGGTTTGPIVFNEGLATVLRGLQIGNATAAALGVSGGYYRLREFRDFNATSNRAIVLEISERYYGCTGSSPTSQDPYVFFQFTTSTYNSSGFTYDVTDAFGHRLQLSATFGTCTTVTLARLSEYDVVLTTQSYLNETLNSCNPPSPEPAFTQPSC